jgi:Domain of unknown function (DUF3127)
MSLEITGKITQILPLETGEGKNGIWKKQLFVIEFMDGNYSKKLCLSLWGDKTSAISDLQEGSEIRVSFNVESREYNQRWYTDARAWRIEPLGQSTASSPAPSAADAPSPVFNESPADENDLPF